jgi:hypothetical protein
MDLRGVGGRRVGVALVVLTALAGASTASAAVRPTIIHEPPMATGPLSGLKWVGNDVVTDQNWAGYAVSATSKFNDVTGSWVQPTATCNTAGASYAAFWSGIDGYTSGTVEQLGTDSDCLGLGQPNYYAWYEMYPAGSVSLSTALYPVKPGDTLTAEVSVTSIFYTLKMKSSEGWSFSTTKIRFFPARSSAELVSEAPSLCSIIGCSQAPLTNFGTVQFSGAEAAAGGADSPFDTFTAGSGPHEIIAETPAKTPVILDQPSALTSSAAGDAFSITWQHS